MFRRFATTIPGGADALFSCHPAVLSTMIETAWRARANAVSADLGRPARRSDLSPLPDFWLGPIRQSAGIEPPHGQPGQPDVTGTSLEGALSLSDAPDQRRTVTWDHLVYAYMI